MSTPLKQKCRRSYSFPQPTRRHLNWFGCLTFFGHRVSALARWPLTKSKYLISLSTLGIFVWFAHQNSCTRQAYSKTEIKMTIFYDRYVLYRHTTLTWPENVGNKTVLTDRPPERLYVRTLVPIVCGSHKWDSINYSWDWPLLLVFVRWPKCQVQLTAPGQERKLWLDWS